MASFQLVSFNLCPFVQRSAIALEEKGTPYQISYVDLSAKPQWFTDISPLGKVPLLRVGERVLFESAVICEYIDESSAGPRLHPSDALERAYDRSWIEFASAALVDCYRLQVAKDTNGLTETAAALVAKFERYEGQLDARGPYFHNERFSMVDCATAPLLQRALWCNEIAPELQLFERTPKVYNWLRALLDRPSVQRSLIPDIHAVFLEYLQGRGSPTRNVGASLLGERVTARG
ncbi:MAG TPA: glutathione S-transferase family protein [Polyangiaceae bacterium]|nr:glutathione S-transferase family protein [Polyangiaceae bacterium]